MTTINKWIQWKVEDIKEKLLKLECEENSLLYSETRIVGRKKDNRVNLGHYLDELQNDE